MVDVFTSGEEVEPSADGGFNERRSTTRATESGDNVRPYLLASQERIVRGRMPTMEVVNERFASNLRIGLFNFIRRSPEIVIQPLVVHRYSDFLKGTESPSNFNIMAIRPMRGSGLILCSTGLIYSVIDMLYGGIGKFTDQTEGRDFSATEQRVITRLVGVIAEEYRKAWKGIYPIELEYQRSEMRSQFANVATPSEIVICSQFSIRLGETVGTIDFCLPYATLEPIRDILYSTTQGDAIEGDRRWVSVLTREIQAVDVTLVAELAQSVATVEDLLSLQIGDFIELEKESSIQASVGGIPVFECRYGTHNGKYALRILKNLGTEVMSLGERLGISR